MKRQIYEVYAKIVDANGTYNTLSGYPKAFDSKSYDNDIDKTLNRATSEFASTWATLLKREDRQLQTVILMSADGFVVDKKVIGKIADIPDPVPVPEPEPEPEPEEENENPA